MDSSKDLIKYKRINYNYMLVIVDCFTKYCWVYMIKRKTPEEIITCYEQLFRIAKPRYLWWDMEKAIDIKKFKEYLIKEGVELYHTYSEIKVSIAERMIRTLKEKCVKIKTECELSKDPFYLNEVLPKVLDEYNNVNRHLTIR
jgi:hypothetical protein